MDVCGAADTGNSSNSGIISFENFGIASVLNIKGRKINVWTDKNNYRLDF